MMAFDPVTRLREIAAERQRPAATHRPAAPSLPRRSPPLEALASGLPPRLPSPPRPSPLTFSIRHPDRHVRAAGRWGARAVTLWVLPRVFPPRGAQQPDFSLVTRRENKVAFRGDFDGQISAAPREAPPPLVAFIDIGQLWTGLDGVGRQPSCAQRSESKRFWTAWTAWTAPYSLSLKKEERGGGREDRAREARVARML